MSVRHIETINRDLIVNGKLSVSSIASSVTLSGSITAGYAVTVANDKHIVATSANLTNGFGFSGIAQDSGTDLQSVRIITQGPVPRSLINLGAGYACSVGVNSTGVPVRVTDVTCVSGLRYLGHCDVNGSIIISP